jgi:hypothetical protein
MVVLFLGLGQSPSPKTKPGNINSQCFATDTMSFLLTSDTTYFAVDTALQDNTMCFAVDKA